MIEVLQNSRFKPPGFWENLRESIFGFSRPLDCVQIEITSICPGACLYCPHTTHKDTWKGRNLEPETLARLWPLLRKTARAHLQGWGEPLLHPHFLEFQSFCARAGCLTSTTSYGLKMDEEFADQLAHSGMDIIAFSLAGTDPESNDARARVPFEKVCASIKTLRKSIARSSSSQPLEIHLAYLMLADRIEAVQKLPELMDELEVDMTVVSTLDYLALPGHERLAFRPHENEKILKARELLEQAAERSGERLIHFALPGNSPPQGGCRENIAKTLYMDAEGNISPCIYLNVPSTANGVEHCTYGNVNATDPLDIWRNTQFKEFRDELLANRPAGACRKCPKRVEVSYG